MADPMTVGSVGTQKVDEGRWKKLTPAEIIKEESKGEEIPPEIITWAQQMAAFAKIPDNVTYEQVDGDVGIVALEKLGIEDEDAVGAEKGNAITPEKPEEPGAVKDVATDADVDNDDEDPNNIFANPPADETGGTPTDEPEEDNPDVELGLADDEITTNDEEIRKRKARHGRE